MNQGTNLALFVVEAVLYFTLLTTLLHFRHRIGLGVFLTALGVIHFVETYLAAVFYVDLPIGIVSPGSSIFFAGKLVMILMLYIKEDAATVRQPIYGLFIGNAVTLLIAQFLLLHHTVSLTPGQTADVAFLREMGLLMLWGTALLYIDSLALILLYERIGRLFPGPTITRIAASSTLVLTFDQVGFYGLLAYLYDAPAAVFWGGWKAKMVAALLYSAMFALYQMFFRDPGMVLARRPIRDIFTDLTFRERYEDLLARTGRDVLTGAFDRGRMEIEAPRLLRESAERRKALSVAIVDVDHFKAVNDRFGHLHGDSVLREVADELHRGTRTGDLLFRYGGEEFVVVLPEANHADAMLISERMRQEIAAGIRDHGGEPITVSIGVATAPEDGANFTSLLAAADNRLYRAKNAGRNRTEGRPDSGI
ncbi:diguanylate cyclase (GGDEF)-like protein [Ciceribacter lividus]|uniref:diguanylate cyclase n=1 Tax=Ciceribacter lividus TaxID=1197950 RepID=A0A6I7HML4_9HYPH|nr:GGDEF domain-containing protein [Ciceribacter lividus]RCW24697.1 diguanylate cyclase (GGDEF)-like protein [Ciceribacter lividus]